MSKPHLAYQLVGAVVKYLYPNDHGVDWILAEQEVEAILRDWKIDWRALSQHDPQPKNSIAASASDADGDRAESQSANLTVSPKPVGSGSSCDPHAALTEPESAPAISQLQEKGFELQVWACGQKHETWLIPNGIKKVHCPCGIEAIPVSEWEKRQKTKPECDHG